MNIESLVAVLTALGGFELIKWLITLIINWRNNKRKNETETDTDEFHLYKERIEELRQANKDLNEQIAEYVKEKAHKEDVITEKVNEIHQLQENRIEDVRTIAQLEKQKSFYQAWFCKREFGNGKSECIRRLPAQNPPLKYNPIDEEENTTI